MITLKAARVNAGLTIKDTAERIGKSSATVSDYENGKISPSFEVVSRMAQIYDVALDDIQMPTKEVII